MTSTTMYPIATRDGIAAAVSPELSIPPLPVTISEEPPLLLSPLRFVDQARLGRNAWWRYALAVVLFVVLVLVTAVALLAGGTIILAGVDGLRSIDAAVHAFYRSGLGVFAWLMLVSALELPILFLVVRLLHRRPWRSLIVGPVGFDWSAFFHSLGLMLAIGCFMFFVEMIAWPGEIRFAFDATRFWPFLALVLLLVPLQTLAEEAIFRGYALQGVARATGQFAVRLVVPALIFAALHFSNAPVVNGGLWPALEYIVVAIYLTFLALRGDGLEHAWGFHLGNNLLATVVITWRGGDFDVPSLFLADKVDYAESFIFAALTCALHFALMLRFSPPRIARRAAPGAGAAIPAFARS